MSASEACSGVDSLPGGDVVSRSGYSVAVVGSRGFPFEMTPDRCVEKVGSVLADTEWLVREVVSGGAEGVDSAAAEWATRVGCPLVEIEPDWDEHGKAAGPMRNTKIVRRADKLVALWNGTSSGTRDSIGKARTILGDENVVVVPIGNARDSLSVEDVSPVPVEE